MCFAPTLLATSLLLVTFAGDSGEPPTEVSDPLAPGESATLELGPCPPAAVTFRNVLADSRCPEDAQCIWAGDVEVEITLTVDDGPSETRSLHTNRGAREAAVGDCVLRVASVEPTARTDRRIGPEDYRVRFELVVAQEDERKAPRH